MRVGVMRHLVSGRGNRANEPGMGRGFFADHKKCRARLMGGQQFQDARRVLRIGTIVDRQPHLAPRSCKPPVRAHQALRLRDEYVIGQQQVGPDPERHGRRGRRPAHEERRHLAGQIDEEKEAHGGNQDNLPVNER